ncbi:response regulator transcription factor [Devosia lacusdianchii]|uniref:response regulator transcription factor n=1 Tax=Devosia lacusdianchii TaxID=2917991 RepID=UPI001F055736|nr:response regulator [Devosia sp. JXJ CY 41]
MTAEPVYLVDDDDAVREAITLLLSTYGLTVESYASAVTFLAHLDIERPGVLLVDLRMPAITGLQLLDRLAERGVDWPVVMMTGHGDVNACRRAFKAGVEDFLTKPVDEQVLVDTLHAGFAALNTIRARHEARALLASLTPREREVLEMATQGWASKEIATALGVSIRTIDAHRAHIAEKLGTSSLAEQVRLLLA